MRVQKTLKICCRCCHFELLAGFCLYHTADKNEFVFLFFVTLEETRIVIRIKAHFIDKLVYVAHSTHLPIVLLMPHVIRGTRRHHDETNQTRFGTHAAIQAQFFYLYIRTYKRICRYDSTNFSSAKTSNVVTVLNIRCNTRYT